MSFDFIAKPFGVLMEFIYNTLAFENYGIAIIIFTIIIKILLMPLQIKQQRSMLKTQEIQPELQELQRTYANDRNKLAEEQQKLYAKHNISMTAGCLPMLIQFPLIMALYEIIRGPLTYISGLSKDAIAEIAKILEVPSAKGIINELTVIDKLMAIEDSKWDEFIKAEEVKENKSDYKIDILTKFKNFDDAAWIEYEKSIVNSYYLIYEDNDENTMSYSERISDIYTWCGLDLSKSPSELAWFAMLIPILSFLSAILMQRLSMARMNNNKKDEKKQEGPNMANGMMKVMPVLSLLIAFGVPAGLGLYWTISNVLSIAQMALINRILAKQKEGRL